MTTPIQELSFLYGTNEAFLAELYARYLDDPAGVDPGWRAFFAELGDEAEALTRDRRGASWAPRGTRVIGDGEPAPAVPAVPAPAPAPPPAPA